MICDVFRIDLIRRRMSWVFAMAYAFSLARVTSLAFANVKANLAFFFRCWREQLPDRGEKLGNRLVVAVEPPLQLRKFRGELSIGRNDFAQANECANNPNARIDRDRTIEDAGQHDGAVFSKSPWQLASASVRS